MASKNLIPHATHALPPAVNGKMQQQQQQQQLQACNDTVFGAIMPPPTKKGESAREAERQRGREQVK